MNKEFTYEIKVNLQWENTIYAEDMYQALDLIKSYFENEHNLTLEDDEIISVKRWKEDE